jgi:hypothetical protein
VQVGMIQSRVADCRLPITVRGPLGFRSWVGGRLFSSHLTAVAHERAQCLKDGPSILLSVYVPLGHQRGLLFIVSSELIAFVSFKTL